MSTNYWMSTGGYVTRHPEAEHDPNWHRVLVVDPDKPEDIVSLAEAICQAWWGETTNETMNRAMRRAVRSLLTDPEPVLQPDEPTHLGAVVWVAARGDEKRFVRCEDEAAIECPWRLAVSGGRYSWEGICALGTVTLGDPKDQS